jgi:isopentenyl-diphosphate Delta-isomerase
MEQEYLPILDADGTYIGRQKRELVHQKGLLHPVVHLWIYDPLSQKVLMQKRSPEKELFPDCYDVSVGGHVIVGQTAWDALMSEAEGELGLYFDFQGSPVPNYVGTKKINRSIPKIGLIDNELVHIYFLAQNSDKMPKLNFKDDEVSKVSWIKTQKLVNDLYNPKLSKKYVPHGLKYYEQVIEELGPLRFQGII